MDDPASDVGAARAQLPYLAFDLYREMQLRHQDRAPLQWEIDAKDQRGKVEEVVVWQEQYDGGPFDFGAEYTDGTLDGVIASLAAIRASIPEEHRAAARCNIDSHSGYEGSHYAGIKVSYRRDETDEEWASRRADVERRQGIEINRQRAEFERLRVLLEPKTSAPSPPSDLSAR